MDFDLKKTPIDWRQTLRCTSWMTLLWVLPDLAHQEPRPQSQALYEGPPAEPSPYWLQNNLC